MRFICYYKTLKKPGATVACRPDIHGCSENSNFLKFISTLRPNDKYTNCFYIVEKMSSACQVVGFQNNRLLSFKMGDIL